MIPQAAVSIVDALIRRGIFSGDDISRSLAAQAQLTWIDLSQIVVPQEIIEEIRPQDARRLKMIPIARNEHGLVVATGDPLDVESIDSLSFLLKRQIELVPGFKPAWPFSIHVDVVILGSLK